MVIFRIAKIVVKPGQMAEQLVKKKKGIPNKISVEVISNHGMSVTLPETDRGVLMQFVGPNGGKKLVEILTQRAQPEITLANKSMETTSSVLAGAKLADLNETLARLYPMALPHLVMGREGNPVHHSLKVLEIMAKIAVGEKFSGGDTRIVCTAALLHDIGLARTSEKKIRVADIEAITDPVEKEKARIDAIQSRKKHMLMGGTLAWELLTEFNRLPENSRLQFSKMEIRKILEIIHRHDDPTIEELTKLSSGEWLFLPEDKLLLSHREADRLWMVTPEGIEADLVKDRKNDPQADPKKRLLNNIKRHEEEAGLYYSAFGNEADLYNFKTGTYPKWFEPLPKGIELFGRTFYSNDTSFGLFNGFLRETAKLFGIPLTEE